MHDDTAQSQVRAAFRQQAAFCRGLGSSLTARVCDVLADALARTTGTGRTCLAWRGDPARDVLPLRLCGGLHALVLTGTDPDLVRAYRDGPDAPGFDGAVRAAVAAQDGALLPWLDGPPQTNEVGRSALLLPGLLAVARAFELPLTLLEIGASAGLNQLPDRFFYRYGEATWGDAASPVRLAPELRGPPPDSSGTLMIARRAGCDVNPIDLEDPAARLRLRAFCWPDQPERLTRLEAAIALAGAERVRVARADAADFVTRSLRLRPEGEAAVVMHSIVWQDLPDATQAALRATLAEAGAAATVARPLAWVRFEPSDEQPIALPRLTVTLWPEGTTQRLAEGHPHGSWLDTRTGFSPGR